MLFKPGENLLLRPYKEELITKPDQRHIMKELFCEKVSFLKFVMGGNALVRDNNGKLRYCNASHLHRTEIVFDEV